MPRLAEEFLGVACECQNLQMAVGVLDEVLGRAHSCKALCAVVGCHDGDMIEQRRRPAFDALVGRKDLPVRKLGASYFFGDNFDLRTSGLRCFQDGVDQRR